MPNFLGFLFVVWMFEILEDSDAHSVFDKIPGTIKAGIFPEISSLYEDGSSRV